MLRLILKYNSFQVRNIALRTQNASEACVIAPQSSVLCSPIVHQPAEQFDCKQAHWSLATGKDMAELSITLLDFRLVRDYSPLVPKSCLAVSFGPRRTFNKRERISLKKQLRRVTHP
jgi:hypothetical protein